jgi:hypothetical protein
MKLGRRLQLLGTAGLTPARLLEAVEVDLIALRDQVQGALRELLKLTGDDCDPWPYVSALYADSVIVDMDGKSYRYPYAVADDLTISFGTPSEVVRAFVPVDAADPAPVVASPVAAAPVASTSVLIEAASGDGVPANSYLVRVIRAGRSLNGNYYSDTLLREAAPMFEGVRVFSKSDSEHTLGQGKDVRNLIGGLTKPRFIEGTTADSGEIQAIMTLICGDDDPVAIRLREAVEKNLSHLFGLSVDVVGTATGTKGNRIAEAFIKVNSVDLIVEPGAGGGIISFVEAVDTGEFMDRAQLIALINGANPALLQGKDLTTITDAELQTVLTTALQATTNSVDPAASNANLTEAVGNQFRMRDLVNGSKLPGAAKLKIIQQFSGNAKFTEAAVTDAIKQEAAYLSQTLVGLGGTVADLGEGSFIEGMKDEREKHDDMLDAFFDRAHKDHRQATSFRECYRAITGDAKVTGRPDRTTRFSEALDTTAFANVLGNSITRRMVADYNAQVDLDIWKLLAGDPVPVNDFRTQERTRFGGYGNLPAVAQSGAYTALTSPTDEKATYAVTKRGGLESVTLEMIKNDDVGAIRRIPTQLARAAKRTLCQFVFDFLVTNPTIYDGVALFHATHGNLSVAAASSASYAAMRLAMMKQTQKNSGEVLGMGPSLAFGPLDLEETFRNMFVRSTNLDKTFVQSLMPTIVPIFYWTDTNDFVLAADPKDIPSLEIGFLDGEEEPSLFVQDLPNVGSFFNNDVLTYKIRHIYGGNLLDYRGLQKAVVP